MSLSILPCCVTNVEIYISMNISISASGSSGKQAQTITYTNSSNGLISIPNANDPSSDPNGCTICGFEGFLFDEFFAQGVEYNELTIPLLGPECPPDGFNCSGCDQTFCDGGATYRITSSNVPDEESDFQGRECTYSYYEDGEILDADVTFSDYCTLVKGNVCGNGGCISQGALYVYNPSLENTPKHSFTANFSSSGIGRTGFSISTNSGGYPISGGLYVNGNSTPTPLYVTYPWFNNLQSWVTNRSISGLLNIGVMYDTDQARNPETGLCSSV